MARSVLIVTTLLAVYASGSLAKPSTLLSAISKPEKPSGQLVRCIDDAATRLSLTLRAAFEVMDDVSEKLMGGPSMLKRKMRDLFADYGTQLRKYVKTVERSISTCEGSKAVCLKKDLEQFAQVISNLNTAAAVRLGEITASVHPYTKEVETRKFRLILSYFMEPTVTEFGDWVHSCAFNYPHA